MEFLLSLSKSAFHGVASRFAGRRRLAWMLGLLVLLVGLELACRAFGLHTPVLYEVTKYGYRVRPDQDLRRFGNRVFYDSLGLRSEPASRLPAPGVMRVLCLGDSIANGGTMTDQAQTYPYLLQSLLASQGRRTEVLNASAPGWAIRNESGWLNENGTLGSQVVVFTINTLDLFQERAGEETIDSHPSFPSRAPTFAVYELVARYLGPVLLRRLTADPGATVAKLSLQDAKENIAVLVAMTRLATDAGATPVVLFVEQPGPLEGSGANVVTAKALLFRALEEHGVAFVDTREEVERAGGQALFRDGMHPNIAGNRVLAALAFDLVASLAGKAR